MMRMLDVDAIVRLVVKDLGLSASDRDAVRRGLPRAPRSNLDEYKEISRTPEFAAWAKSRR